MKLKKKSLHEKIFITLKLKIILYNLFEKLNRLYYADLPVTDFALKRVHSLSKFLLQWHCRCF